MDMTQRWALHDPLTGESWTFPVNPNAMTSPRGPRALTILATTPISSSRTSQGRVMESNMDPYEWQFSGFIRTQEHHDDLLYWCLKVNRLELTDHLDRTWLIRMTQFVPDEKRPTARVGWRFDYQVKALNYGRIAS